MSRLPAGLHVINLDDSGKRLAAVLDSYDAHLAGSGIALDRFVAVGADEVARQAVPGRLSWPEKACFVSHARCLQAAAERTPGRHVWVAEDDVVFGATTVARVASALRTLEGTDWDVLLTDVFATEPFGMVELYQLWRRAMREGAVKVFDLRTLAFAGATSYLVNAGSVEKLLALYRGQARLDLGVDIWLKALAGSGRIGCYGVMPFATSVAGSPSQIQPDGSGGHLAWWYAFRWAIWDDADLARVDALLDGLEQSFDDADARRVGRILGGMLSPRWEPYLQRK